MKLSGIDWIFIDWPGTQNKYDYPLLVRNTLKIVSLTAKVGLNYSIAYEDQNLVQTSDKAGQVKADMTVLQTNLFKDGNYETIPGHHVPIVFAPRPHNR